MRRFLITSPAFTGQAELLFRADGTLVTIDIKQTNMPKAILRLFKDRCPAHIEEMEAAFKGTQATVVEAEFEVTFDMFWKDYDHKINRKRSEPLWNKLTKTQQVKAYYGIVAYDKYLKATGYRKKADPENYLRNEMWENEYK